MEFKQRETKAAFMVINAMKEQLAEIEMNNTLRQEHLKTEKFETPEHKEQQEMFLTTHWMEAQLLKDNIEKLQEQIENQTFDF